MWHPGQFHLKFLAQGNILNHEESIIVEAWHGLCNVLSGVDVMTSCGDKESENGVDPEQLWR